MEKVSINGMTMAYERRGNGKPLMLLHGFPLDSRIWNEVAPLLENNFDLIIPDLRGFGESSSVETVYSMSDMADDLARLLDHLGLGKTAIAGHSMGGYVTLAFARKYAGRVNGLGLVSSQAAADSPERKEGRYKTASDVFANGVSVVADAMTPKLSADTRVQEFARGVIEGQNPSGVIGALKAMAEREDAQMFLPTVSHPLVLIHGDEDALIPIDRAKEIKATVPSAQFAELHGAGHMPMMEFPKETAEGLRLLN